MQFVSRYRCGGYADDTAGAVSTTGHGESISKVCNYLDLDSIMSSSMDFLLALVKVRIFMGYCVLLSWIIAKLYCMSSKEASKNEEVISTIKVSPIPSYVSSLL